MKRWILRITTMLLLLVLALQVLRAVFTNSSTFDEANHITRGYAVWRTGDFRMSIAHPPLINLLSGVPLLYTRTPDLPLDDPSWRKHEIWSFAHRFFWENGGDGQVLTVLGRLPIVLLALVLAALVCLWAARLYGQRAGLFALALCAFEPNLLAHAGLATTDLGVTLFSFLAVYLLWHFLRTPSTWRLIALGAAFGAAQLSKFSALLLVPIFVVLIIIAMWRSQDASDSIKRRLTRGLAWFVLIMLIGFVVIWLGYGLQAPPVLGHQAHHKLLERIIPDPSLRTRLVGVLERAPLPARQYFAGLAGAFGHQVSGHAAYLLGHSSRQGWWYYFLVAFLVKTPLPLLLFSLWVIIGTRRGWRKDEWFLLVPIIFIILSTFRLQINIGLRHILPMYPFLFVFAARILRERQSDKQSIGVWRPVRNFAVALLMLWHLGRTAWIGPHYLAYFNELAGGPEGGRCWLVDSNLDWGQDLIWLRQVLERRNIKQVKLSYFGSAPPEAYGIKYEPLAGVSYTQLMSDQELRERCQPTQGWVAISATCLHNISGYLGDDISFHWLHKYQPVNRAGYGILLFHIPETRTMSVNEER